MFLLYFWSSINYKCGLGADFLLLLPIDYLSDQTSKVWSYPFAVVVLLNVVAKRVGSCNIAEYSG